MTHVLVAYDGSPAAVRALERVAALAKADARITVVTVAEPIYRSPPYTGYADPRETKEHAGLLAQAIEALRERGLEAASELRVGSASDEIVAAARESGADLVVVGRRGKTVAHTLGLGSVSEHVVRESPCDVLVVH